MSASNVPNLKDIRRRIDSVGKTQQITRAMRMVAGAKLRRSQQAIDAARPYSDRMRGTLSEVARAQTDATHPLFEVREQLRSVEFVVVSSDRGLCGAFNANVVKHSEALVSEALGAGRTITVTTAGGKVRDHYGRRQAGRLGGDYPQESWVEYGQAAEIARRVASRYAAGEVDEVRLVYSEFVSALTQTPRDVRLVPFAPDDTGAGEDTLAYEIEPNAQALLAALVPRALEVEIYRALLENQAGEHAARMAAMEAATRNTEELIEKLTLQYNRARQAAITKELVEIVSGAEAL
ncbi:MAG: ATP synthase F1 subunit gamma [Myxococcota bacterium]|nr:ATP synthase F1 subunit gamma [Myxococcota bacterium]